MVSIGENKINEEKRTFNERLMRKHISELVKDVDNLNGKLK